MNATELKERFNQLREEKNVGKDNFDDVRGSLENHGDDLTNIHYCYGCIDCNNCILCIDLRDKKTGYWLFNEEVTEAVFNEALSIVTTREDW